MSKRTQKTVVQKKRLLIVDDHPVVRDGLRSYIESQPDLLVCAEAATAAAAFTTVEQQRPDLAVIDLYLKDSHGLDLIKNLHILHPDLFLLAFSMHSEHDYAERILRAGGHGYLDKSQGSQRLLEAVRCILAGELSFSPAVLQRLLQQTRTAGARLDRQSHSALSDREKQVFELLGEGLNAKETSQRLGIKHKTVEEYRRRLQHKLRLPDGHAVHRSAFLTSMAPRLTSVLPVGLTASPDLSAASRFSSLSVLVANWLS